MNKIIKKKCFFCKSIKCRIRSNTIDKTQNEYKPIYLCKECWSDYVEYLKNKTNE